MSYSGIFMVFQGTSAIPLVIENEQEVNSCAAYNKDQRKLWPYT